MLGLNLLDYDIDAYYDGATLINDWNENYFYEFYSMMTLKWNKVKNERIVINKSILVCNETHL